CDFSGYSLIAIGCAMCLGFQLTMNFKSPFAAMGFSDFWRRWHISLSTWLRDYLYIPLGGSRKGNWKIIRNLMLTMLLGGLWHGAAWTFVVWGVLHGLYLILERGVKKMAFFKNWTQYKLGRIVVMFLTFMLVMLAFVVFRAENFEQAVLILSAMFVPGTGQNILPWSMWSQIVMLSFTLLLVIQWYYRDKLLGDVLQRMPVVLRSLLLSFCLIMIVISSGNSDAFIYFQF
ncbi:MAG: MBOAT family protein, partial [Proteobacteria bacterium]|nr:MBOAT family protein [Pseudomonadota bacterium]